jgi:hypothetical protein
VAGYYDGVTSKELTMNRNDSTARNADRLYTVTVDGIGQVFASDCLHTAALRARVEGDGACIAYRAGRGMRRAFVAFIAHDGSLRATSNAPIPVVAYCAA